MNVLNFFVKSKATNKQAPIVESSSVSCRGEISWEGGGWEPAGYDMHGNYVVLSRKTGQLTTLKAQDLEERKLLLKLGPRISGDYQIFNSQTRVPTFDPKLLTQVIQADCDEMGLFDEALVRGPGMYRDGDTLVANFGNFVATSEGEILDTAPLRRGTSYQSGPSLGFSMHTPLASHEDVQRVVDAVNSFGLQRPGDAKLLLGWLAMAFYGPVLSHRPIVAITAERGAGKTTLLEFFNQLLGPQAMRRDGVPTVAQVIYELEKRPAALLVDELEARRSKLVAVENFLETLRIGFSNTSSHRMSRVIGGKQRYFNAPAGVLVAGIGLPAFNPATESRTVRICLNMPGSGSQASYQPLFDSANESETSALGSRVRRLLLSRWSVMRDTLGTVREMLVCAGHELRSADKFAPLVSGYIALTRASVPLTGELRVLLDEFGLLKPQEHVVERDTDVCMRVLLDRKVAVFAPGYGDSPQKIHMTIREVIQAVVHGPDELRKPLTMQLEEFGVRPMWCKTTRTWQLAICASEHHSGMRRLMQRTDWALGGWKDVLLRMPGAESKVQKVAKAPQRVVLMAMPAELLELPEDESYDFPASDAQAAELALAD